MKDSLDTFAKRLDYALGLRGVSEELLAKKIGVTQQAINNWRNEKNKNIPNPV